MIRQGSCNRCGQCCGADGSPEQDNPWPDTWPEDLRNWQEGDITSSFWIFQVIFQVIKHPKYGGSSSGTMRVGGKNYRYIWVLGHGLCKDRPPWGNTASFSEECPFLMDDPGDGTRPCAFVASPPFDVVWEHDCQPAPPMQKTPEEVVIWFARHPECSYRYE